MGNHVFFSFDLLLTNVLSWLVLHWKKMKAFMHCSCPRVCVYSLFWLSHSLQVILSTNIAESSITVPDIKYGEWLCCVLPKCTRFEVDSFFSFFFLLFSSFFCSLFFGCCWPSSIIVSHSLISTFSFITNCCFIALRKGA